MVPPVFYWHIRGASPCSILSFHPLFFTFIAVLGDYPEIIRDWTQDREWVDQGSTRTRFTKTRDSESRELIFYLITTDQIEHQQWCCVIPHNQHGRTVFVVILTCLIYFDKSPRCDVYHVPTLRTLFFVFSTLGVNETGGRTPKGWCRAPSPRVWLLPPFSGFQSRRRP